MFCLLSNICLMLQLLFPSLVLAYGPIFGYTHARHSTLIFTLLSPSFNTWKVSNKLSLVIFSFTKLFLLNYWNYIIFGIWHVWMGILKNKKRGTGAVQMKFMNSRLLKPSFSLWPSFTFCDDFLQSQRPFLPPTKHSRKLWDARLWNRCLPSSCGHRRSYVTGN